MVGPLTEINFLNFFLCVAFGLAPLMTNDFFLKNSATYFKVHVISLLFLLLGIFLNNSVFFIPWPLLCLLGFYLYLKSEFQFIFSVRGMAGSIPFVFSMISSVWIIAGVFDLHLLGYDRTWSFYAALHASFLGWLFVGCLSHLSKRDHFGKLYLVGCYLCLILFLCVALGIDGVPYIKSIGLIGFTILVPFFIGLYTFHLKSINKASWFFGLSSFAAVTISMLLATLNHFWLDFPKFFLGIPTMVISHGLFNALIAIPGFFLAIKFERNGL